MFFNRHPTKLERYGYKYNGSNDNESNDNESNDNESNDNNESYDNESSKSSGSNRENEFEDDEIDSKHVRPPPGPPPGLPPGLKPNSFFANDILSVDTTSIDTRNMKAIPTTHQQYNTSTVPTIDIYEEVVVNMIVIAAITVNSKISTKGTYLNLESAGYIPEGVRRWYRQDNRDEAIKKIDRIIGLSFPFLEKIETKHQMKQYITNARVGILNLKETYSTCIQTAARINAIIDKIDVKLMSIDTVEINA